MGRTARLSVMLAEAAKADLKQKADSMGMTESALSAYIIGNWLATQNAVNKSLQDAMGSQALSKVISDVMTAVKAGEGEA